MKAILLGEKISMSISFADTRERKGLLLMSRNAFLAKASVRQAGDANHLSPGWVISSPNVD
jgi:hypothetical protein